MSDNRKWEGLPENWKEYWQSAHISEDKLNECQRCKKRGDFILKETTGFFTRDTDEVGKLFCEPCYTKWIDEKVAEYAKQQDEEIAREKKGRELLEQMKQALPKQQKGKYTRTSFEFHPSINTIEEVDRLSAAMIRQHEARRQRPTLPAPGSDDRVRNQSRDDGGYYPRCGICGGRVGQVGHLIANPNPNHPAGMICADCLRHSVEPRGVWYNPERSSGVITSESPPVSVDTFEAGDIVDEDDEDDEDDDDDDNDDHGQNVVHCALCDRTRPIGHHLRDLGGAGVCDDCYSAGWRAMPGSTPNPTHTTPTPSRTRTCSRCGITFQQAAGYNVSGEWLCPKDYFYNGMPPPKPKPKTQTTETRPKRKPIFTYDDLAPAAMATVIIGIIGVIVTMIVWNAFIVFFGEVNHVMGGLVVSFILAVLGGAIAYLASNGD